jgi:hypothetical protein
MTCSAISSIIIEQQTMGSVAVKTAHGHPPSSLGASVVYRDPDALKGADEHA